jgi:hypothetical protein
VAGLCFAVRSLPAVEDLCIAENASGKDMEKNLTIREP